MASQTDDRPVRPMALTICGYGLALWSLAYALPHMIWAAGNKWGLSAVLPAVSTIPDWRTINAIASVILCIAALLGVAFVRLWRARRYRGLLLAIGLFGCAIGIAHGVYGIADRALTVAGLKSAHPGPGGQGFQSWLLWDLLVFEPWFLIEGLLIGLTGWHFIPKPENRRRWALACAAGVVIALALALVRFKVG